MTLDTGSCVVLCSKAQAGKRIVVVGWILGAGCALTGTVIARLAERLSGPDQVRKRGVQN